MTVYWTPCIHAPRTYDGHGYRALICSDVAAAHVPSTTCCTLELRSGYQPWSVHTRTAPCLQREAVLDPSAPRRGRRDPYGQGTPPTRNRRRLKRQEPRPALGDRIGAVGARSANLGNYWRAAGCTSGFGVCAGGSWNHDKDFRVSVWTPRLRRQQDSHDQSVVQRAIRC